MKLSRKYAQAYLNVAHDLTYDAVLHIVEMGKFLKAQRQALFLLSVPSISDEVKKAGLAAIMERVKAPASFMPLISLLLVTHRLYLLAEVCFTIDSLYREMHHIHTVIIASSSPLASDQKEAIEHFLAARVKGTILYTYRQDPALIAGIRIQSDTLLWEYSINQHLRDLQRGH